MNANASGASDKFMNDRAVQDLGPSRARGFSDYDLGCAVRIRLVDYIDCDAPSAARHRHGVGAQPFSQAERVGNAITLFFRELRAPECLDIDGHPGRMQLIGEPFGIPDQLHGASALADANEHSLARRQRARTRICVHVSEELCVYPLRGPSQCELAQGRQASRRKIVRDRTLNCPRDVNFALLHPSNEVLWREIDQLDLVGLVEDRIRYGLSHSDTGDLSYDVVQALDMLDVERRPNREAGSNEVLNILVPLRMAASRRVGMSQIVDEHKLWAAQQDRVEVDLTGQVPRAVCLSLLKDIEAFD